MGQARASFDRRRIRRRLAGIATALLLALGLTISPAASRIAQAADNLRVSADATYTLDPGAGRVHVVIQYEVTDLKPNTSRFIYYYRAYTFGIQREAKSIRASDSGGALSIETKNHPYYIELTVDFRHFIYYRDTAKFTVRYDLVGGAPRSESSIRIGKAFATFGVWAWGDAGQSRVEVDLPQGFGSTIDGDPMSKTSTAGRETLRAKPSSPESFFAILSAENPLAYKADRLSLAGGVEIVVMAWPEDTRWDDTVRATLSTGMPELRELIGLDWPVEHDLNVRERYTPALEGYAGVFFTEQQRIDVSEDLDPVVIVHEASHAWFNEDLFVERWIYEGLAQEYAWRVQQAVGGEDDGLPERPDTDDPGFVRLSQWTFPEVIRDQKTDDRERYGYQASFWVMHRIVDTVGVDRMRTAFAAAAADVTPYPGAAAPEKMSGTPGWERFLDLVESLERTDSADTERSLTDFVLTTSAIGDLQDRADARKAYRELLDAGHGWLPGWYVRKQMSEWRFDVAEQRIAAASAVLALRLRVDDAASALGLDPDGALKTAYEGASDSLDQATALANDELAALAAIAEAKTKVESEPDLVSQIGLLGSTPQMPYDAARAAFERGDIVGAKASAAAAAALMADAAALGQQRLVLGTAVVVGLLVLLVVLLALRRRRRQRLVLGSAALAEGQEAGVKDPVPAEPYATLAADPDPAPPISSERPPDAEGGAAPL
jgi:hypothetical protein